MADSKRGGFTMVEIVIAMGLAAVVALGMASMMSQMQKANLRTTTLANAQNIRANFQEMMRNERAWTNTLNDPENKTFKCLVTLGECGEFRTPEAERTFQVRDAANGIFYKGLLPGTGFTQGGAPCDDYPSARCVLHMQLTWQALCPEHGPCILPQFVLTGKLIYTPGAPGSAFAFNPENYGFKVAKSLSEEELSRIRFPDGSPSGVPLTPGAVAPPPVVTITPAQPGAPAETPGAPVTLPPEMKAMCSMLGGQLKDPEFTQMMANRIRAMGYTGSTDDMIKDLQTTCAAQNAQAP